jgi:predicted transposase YbfD/YdcC
MILYMNTIPFPPPSDPSTRSLLEHFRDILDPRIKLKCAHELGDILVIGLCTLLCGGEGFNDMEDFGYDKEAWLRTFLRLPHGIPSHDTFNRVFSAIKPAVFLDSFMRWTQSLRRAVSEEVVALDGKALRRALRQGSVPHIVSAWATANGLALGQVRVADKSNEITAVPELLRALELAGCIVTLDAMGCQKKIAREIVEADADYVLALKGNQEAVHEEIKTFLDDAIRCAPGTLAYTETLEKGHGRIETRRYWQSDRLDWFADRDLWEGLRSVGVVEAEREIQGQIQRERRYFLSSLTINPERFARAVRGHWGIENALHWVLDVQFGEDQSRARTGHAAENLAALRRFALNLLKRETTKKRGIKGKQKHAGWNHDYLLRLLGLSVASEAGEAPAGQRGA